MSDESSNNGAQRQFLPDTKRGYWALPKDFIFAGATLGLRMDLPIAFSFSVTRMSFLVILPYLICLALYIVPIMVIQGFLGQFSSSGFISAFRLSPLFKGMGYLALTVDFVILSYYTIFANIPLLFVFNSFRWTLPWSCESGEWRAWSIHNGVHNCNIKEVISNNGSFYYLTSTSQLYFQSYFARDNYNNLSENVAPILPLEMLACSLLTWGVVTFVLTRYFNAEKFSKVVRYGMCTVLVLLLVCCTRFLLLPGALKTFDIKQRDFSDFGYHAPYAIIHSTMVLGSGFGTFISVSSFNRFNSNIMRQTWYIAIGQLTIFFLFIIITKCFYHHFLWMVAEIDEETADFTGMFEEMFIYFHAASAITSMEFPNLWTFVFYGMLTISAWMVMLVQLYSILTTIFDEFEYLRQKRKEFTFGLIGVLAICSAYFSTSDGVYYFKALQLDAIIPQASLHLLLLLVVLWIYGRERFQRDIEFMIGQPFRTWKVNVVRFLAPLFLLYVALQPTYGFFLDDVYRLLVVRIASFSMITLPGLAIPLYAIWSLYRTSGSLIVKLKRCARAANWYPIQPDDRQRYEESGGNLNLPQQFRIIEHVS